MSINTTPRAVRLNDTRLTQTIDVAFTPSGGQPQNINQWVDVLAPADTGGAVIEVRAPDDQLTSFEVGTTTPFETTRFDLVFELNDRFTEAVRDPENEFHKLARQIRRWLRHPDGSRTTRVSVMVGESQVVEEIVEPVRVTLQRAGVGPEPNGTLWDVLHERTEAIGFHSYQRFVDRVFDEQLTSRRAITFRGRNAYEVLKVATEMFLLQEAPVIPGVRDVVPRAAGLLDLSKMREEYYEEVGRLRTLPYLHDIVQRLSELPDKSPLALNGDIYGILPDRISWPVGCELLWSYWHEEAMLDKSMTLIAARFQNRHIGPATSALSRLDLDPLRPLSNLFWGWVADDYQRLTVRRRAAEYEFEYGLPLFGRTSSQRVRPAERRSAFLQAFHHLLFACHEFFKESDDTTVVADAFPVLNALREVHLLLAQGATNQFGDLPVTSRAEFMIEQWILARPEMREFLGGRTMVPYSEPWMDRVDTMKTLVGWPEATVTHFRDLAHFGEPILLSIRWDDWNAITDRNYAAAWATSFRDQIQRYVHAYRAVTGVDLTRTVDATPPGILLRRAARARAM